MPTALGHWREASAGGLLYFIPHLPYPFLFDGCFALVFRPTRFLRLFAMRSLQQGEGFSFFWRGTHRGQTCLLAGTVFAENCGTGPVGQHSFAMGRRLQAQPLQLLPLLCQSAIRPPHNAGNAEEHGVSRAHISNASGLPCTPWALALLGLSTLCVLERVACGGDTSVLRRRPWVRTLFFGERSPVCG